MSGRCPPVGYLKISRLQARSCDDGYAALEVARTFSPDAALLDIELPNMSGHDLAVQLRAAIKYNLFLIAVTGYGRPSDYKSSRDAGFDVHLV
jgi:DNA-binding response OmpR family regulator